MKNKLLVLIILCITFLCGCSPSTEIDKLMIVSGLSIDGKDEYNISTQIVNLQDASQNNLSPIVLKTSGKTIADAMASLSQLEGQKLYFTHAQTILISSEILETEGVSHMINLLNMAPRFRSSIRLAATVGKASDVLSTEPNTDPISAFSIRDSISESYRAMKAPDVPFYIFLNDTLEHGIDGILPLITVSENDDSSLPYICGTALFKDTVMVGSLTPDETKFLLLARGKVNNAVFTSENYSFLINSGKSKMQYKNGKLQFTLKMELSLLEGNDPDNPELERIVKSDIENGITRLFDKLKKLDCDPIGVGRCINRSSPDYWAKIFPDQWSHIYSTLSIDYNIRVSMVPSPKLAGKDE